MKLKNGESLVPFWGSSTRFIPGRDMLGMQNSSTATYATLLPGLTNLTSRMRYYGFFVWLLEQYALEMGIPDVSEFRKFIRRGELLLSFIMLNNNYDENGVQGSLFARRILSTDWDNINIANGADKGSTNETYWNYSSGAFGQYYQGSLTVLGLIAPSELNEKIMVCTSGWGRVLASHFDSNLSENSKTLFLNTIINGSINKNGLDYLASDFDLNSIIPNSEEWLFYVDLLLGADNPIVAYTAASSYFRKETILLYLEFLNNPVLSNDNKSFHQSFYDGSWIDNPFVSLDASRGWHYYALNEYSHFSVESLLWVLLKDLDSKGMIELPSLLKWYSDRSIETIIKDRLFRGIFVNTTFNEFAEISIQNGLHPFEYANMIKNVDHSDIFKAVSYALGMMAHIYLVQRSNIVDLLDYSRNNGMNRDGDAIELFNWIDTNSELRLKDFIEKMLLQNVINRHLEVAMNKMRNRNENTQKFLLDNFILKPIGITEPTWTGPRIYSLHTFLKDLNLITSDNTLTEYGIAILNERQ